MLYPGRLGGKTLFLITTCFVLSLTTIGFIFAGYFLITHTQSSPASISFRTHSSQHGHVLLIDGAANDNDHDRHSGFSYQMSDNHQRNSSSHQRHDVIDARLKQDNHRKANTYRKKKMKFHETDNSPRTTSIRPVTMSDAGRFVDDDTLEASEEFVQKNQPNLQQQQQSSDLDTIYIDDNDRLIADSGRIWQSGSDYSRLVSRRDDQLTETKQQLSISTALTKRRKHNDTASSGLLQQQRRKLVQDQRSISRAKAKKLRLLSSMGRVIARNKNILARNYKLNCRLGNLEETDGRHDRNSQGSASIDGSGSGDGLIDDDDDSDDGIYKAVTDTRQHHIYQVFENDKLTSNTDRRQTIAASVSPSSFQRIATENVTVLMAADQSDRISETVRRFVQQSSPVITSANGVIAAAVSAEYPNLKSSKIRSSAVMPTIGANKMMPPPSSPPAVSDYSNDSDKAVSNNPSLQFGFHQNSGAWLETRARRIMGNVKKSEERSRQLLLCAEAGGGELCRMLFKGHLNE